MKRGEIYWADLGARFGRRPVLVLTRDAAIPALGAIVVAAVTTTIRGIASEVHLGPEDGLPRESAVSCDNLATVPKAAFDPEPLGRLGPAGLRSLDRALRYALEIRF